MDTVSRFLELLTEEEATALLHSNVSPMLRGELRTMLGTARNRALARLNDELRMRLDPALDPRFAPCYHGVPHGMCRACHPTNQ